MSANFTRNAENQTAAILTFALLDLPLEEAGSHGYRASEVGRGMELKPAGNLILFKKEVREAPLEVTNDILVTHRYVPVQDSVGSEASKQAIPGEFLSNRAYSCEVIVTNVSPETKNFSILYQVPHGALPINLTKYMKSVQQSLSPYTTNKLVFHFYFPKSGSFTHFASNVAADEKIIARATPNQAGTGSQLKLKVVTKLSVSKKETFMDIL